MTTTNDNNKRVNIRCVVRFNHQINMDLILFLTVSSVSCTFRSLRARCLSYNPSCQWWSSTDWTYKHWPPCDWSSSTCQSSWQLFRKRSEHMIMRSFSKGFYYWRPDYTAAWTNSVRARSLVMLSNTQIIINTYCIMVYDLMINQFSKV